MYEVFQKLLMESKVEETRLTTLRVKAHNSCQLRCDFCHMEGNSKSEPVRNDVRFSDTVTKFRDRFGFTEVHFTGGEPSIHPEIVGLIESSKRLGMKVKMTTNGQTKLSRYDECIDGTVANSPLPNTPLNSNFMV